MCSRSAALDTVPSSATVTNVRTYRRSMAPRLVPNAGAASIVREIIYWTMGWTGRENFRVLQPQQETDDETLPAPRTRRPRAPGRGAKLAVEAPARDRAVRRRQHN